MYDLMVVGGGPAALAAAFYAQSKRLNAAIIYDELGGKTTWQHNRINDEEVNDLPGNEILAAELHRPVGQEGATQRIQPDPCSGSQEEDAAEERHGSEAVTVQTESVGFLGWASFSPAHNDPGCKENRDGERSHRDDRIHFSDVAATRVVRRVVPNERTEVACRSDFDVYRDWNSQTCHMVPRRHVAGGIDQCSTSDLQLAAIDDRRVGNRH